MPQGWAHVKAATSHASHTSQLSPISGKRADRDGFAELTLQTREHSQLETADDGGETRKLANPSSTTRRVSILSSEGKTDSAFAQTN